MTVAGKVKQTIASLKGVQTTLETFASVEADEESKHLLEQNAERVGGVITSMEDRLARLEFEEPQYKGF